MRHAARTNTGRYVSRLTSGTLAVVMAGGRGERLKGLTQHRCKPAIARKDQKLKKTAKVKITKKQKKEHGL